MARFPELGDEELDGELRRVAAAIVGGPRGSMVEGDADQLSGRDVVLDGIREAAELLDAVALHAPPDHGALKHVEGGEQGGGSEAAGLHRQAGWVRSSA